MSGPSRSTLLPAAAAGLALSAGAKASAQIVYSGLLNETFTASDPLTIDVNGDGITDGTLSISSGTLPSSPPVSYTKPTFTPANGALISEPNLSGVSVMGSSLGSGSLSANLVAGTAYFGVELNLSSGTTPLYGWVEDSFDGNGTGTIVGYAYNASGGDIETGQTVSAVPELPATGMLAGAAALIAGSAVLLRRRRSAALQAA